MNDYIVENPNLVLLSQAEQIIKGNLYGIGVKAAVAKQKAEGLNKGDSEYDVPNQLTTIGYEQDAIPNGKGGYSKTSRWDGRMSSSLIGMPVMCALRFVGREYKELGGGSIIIPDITFETVVITLNMNKNINMTNITGRDTGSVKEYIGMGDWNIDIRAIITADAPLNDKILKRNQEGVYPRDNMRELWRVLRAPVSIQVDCWFLNQFDIRFVTITSGVNIEQIEGQYTQQRLIIPALSDNPLIIRIGV